VSCPASLQILKEMDRLIAVMKPAGLATIPGRDETDSVLQQLAAQLNLPCIGEADPRVRVVHRLDKQTSGVLLMATTIEAQRHLSHQFQNNRVLKEYWAICVGQPAQREGEIDAPLCANPGDPKRMMISESRGRPARTAWKIEQSFGDYHLVKAWPKTGKTHQIRVHLKAVGLPLAVDPLYHPVRGPAETGLFLSQFKRNYKPNAMGQERPLIDRLTLHAYMIRFEDLAGLTVEITAEPPKDFRATINQLSKFGHR
jgi:23S rRNA pseudouridine955/2504/2580 synthase/23S rRNA pseudouridine1911/1915/1917 synthase